ncbi:MAG: pentapeptide repeat-containing protein [Desulfobulbaceae bacterium]
MLSFSSPKSWFRFLLLVPLLVVPALSGCAPTTVKQIEEERGAKQLSPDEVLKLVEGNTLFFRAYGEDSHFYYAPTGQVFGQDVLNNRDKGKWDVSDSGELCMKLDWWWYGDLRCFPVYGDGRKYYMGSESGVLSFSAELLQGDAKRLYREIKTTGKKSYRASVRGQQSGSAGLMEQEAAPVAEETQAAPPLEEEPRQDIPPAAPGELKATVKWMARDCPGCNFAGSNLKKADLVGAKLQGADLSGADLSMANLRRADLQGANLSGADLSFANLPGADLRGSNLQGARFKGANLIKANLTGAKLEGADFSEALLEGTQGLPR